MNTMQEGLERHFSATLTTDASGSWGCGGLSSSGRWFQVRLGGGGGGGEIHITVKELSLL